MPATLTSPEVISRPVPARLKRALVKLEGMTPVVAHIDCDARGYAHPWFTRRVIEQLIPILKRRGVRVEIVPEGNAVLATAPGFNETLYHAREFYGEVYFPLGHGDWSWLESAA